MGLRRVVMPAWLRAVCVLLLLGGCAPLISEYSLDAYKNATSLKAETLALVDVSGEKFTVHRAQVEALTTKINAAYEFAAGIPDNQLSAGHWQLLRNPDGNLYGGFVRTWMEQGTVSPAYRTAKRKQISDAFDQIVCLEVNKKETKGCGAVVAASQ
jgi:hypothetical protein